MARTSKKPKGATRVEAPAPVVVEAAEVEAPVLVASQILDEILALQLLVGWAGEGLTDPPRLGWWRTSLGDEFGGEDIFKQLTPRTWKWAVLEAARAAARMVDAEMRSHAADGDQLISLFHFGFVLDEQLDDRLAELKRNATDPVDALPALAAITQPWSADAFRAHLKKLGPVAVASSSVGVRLKGEMPHAPDVAARQLAAAMSSPSERYPAAHWKVDA